MTIRLAACLAAALLCAAPALAEERILAYDVEVDVNRDGSLLVTEHIRVRAEGQQIRRGITRDFPTRYPDRYGNQVRVGFELLSVRRDGAPEASFVERRWNGIRINTGGDASLPVPADYTFTLQYRTTRQIGFFDDHDELYWNAIGTGSVFPIERGTVDVRLPEPVPIDRMSAEAYTGPQGARGASYEASLPVPGVAHYRLTQPLAPREGFTIVLTFPKGVVSAPTVTQRIGWMLADNRGVLVALSGAGLLLLFCVGQWRRVGRDPRPGVTFPRYEPPQGQTPADLRYVRRMGYDTRCFSSDLLALAVAGHLRIDRQARRFRTDQWTVERQTDAPDPASLPASQRALLERLLPAGTGPLVLDKKHASRISRAREAHRKALDGVHHPRHFRRNSWNTLIATAIAAATIVVAIWVSGGYGVPLIMIVSAFMIIGVVIFARLVRAPTTEGRTLLDTIEGLTLYLTVAEREELARLAGPEPPVLDAGRYETLLPFAVALGVEEAWTRKFTDAVGAAEAEKATAAMVWYSGHGQPTSLRSFSSAIGSSLSSQVASASSPPGSSSGSGGGGSSGGGGGGGGVGGR